MVPRDCRERERDGCQTDREEGLPVKAVKGEAGDREPSVGTGTGYGRCKIEGMIVTRILSLFWG